MQRYDMSGMYDEYWMSACDDGDYVLHYEAQAEIARLTADVDRLKKINLKLSADRHVPAMRVSIEKAKSEAQATDDYMALLNERDTAWNDAIEAAAQVANDYDHYELESAIRALKRPT